MKNTNDNTKQPWHGCGGGRGNSRKGSGGGRGQQGQRQDGTKKDKKIHQSIPFTSHNASTHHTYSDTKESFVRAASIKLGEYANDVRNALETEVAYAGARPTRGPRAALMLTTMPVRPVKRENEANISYEGHLDDHMILVNAHLQERAQRDFEQATLDMEYKADMSEYQKRENVYKRNTTRAFDLLISQYCSTVIKERLEQESD